MKATKCKEEVVQFYFDNGFPKTSLKYPESKSTIYRWKSEQKFQIKINSQLKKNFNLEKNLKEYRDDELVCILYTYTKIKKEISKQKI